MKKFFMLALVAVIAAPAGAAVLSADLGSGGVGGARPTGTVLGHPWECADRGPQDAIGTFSSVSSVSIPPFGTMGMSPSLQKRTTPGSWTTWSGVPRYNGTIFFNSGGSPTTLTLPAGMQGFSFYLEPNSFSTFSYRVTTDSGVSLTLPATGLSGAHGWAFATDDGSTIASVTMTRVAGFDSGYAIAEFCGASGGAPPSGDCPCIEELDALEAKLDAIEAKLDDLATLPDDVAAIEAKADAIEGKLDAMEVKLDALDYCELIRLLLPIIKHAELPTDHPCYVPPEE